MQRITVNDKQFLIGYHTQEFRYDSELSVPLKCTMDNAWLGMGYYFWIDLEFAQYWGEDFKSKKNGYYDIYTAQIDINNCINAVFNEEHYLFFRRCIEKSIEHFTKHNLPVTLKEIHEFLLNKFWKEHGITGILYDDLPYNPNNKANRKYSVVEYKEYHQIKYFYYKKRIQIVVFNLKNVHNFELHLEKQT